MMSAKRTRKRESSDTVCLTLNPHLTRQTASVINSPQPYLPPPPKRQKAGSAAGDKACNQDQAATVRCLAAYVADMHRRQTAEPKRLLPRNARRSNPHLMMIRLKQLKSDSDRMQSSQER